MASWEPPQRPGSGSWWEPERPPTVARRPIGNLIRTAFGVYSRSFGACLGLSGTVYLVGAVALVPAYLALSDVVGQLVAATPVEPVADLTPYRDVLGRLFPQEAALTLVVAIVTGFVQVLALGAVAGGTPEAALGQPVRYAAAVRRWLARLAPMLGLAALLVLVQAGVSVAAAAMQLAQPAFLDTTAGGVDLSGLGSTLGLVLLALLVIVVLGSLTYYLYLRWFVAIPLMVVDGLGLRAALGRSATLTQGSRWYILGALVLLALLQALVTLLVELLAAILGLALGAGSLVGGTGSAGGVGVAAGLGSLAGPVTAFSALIDLLMSAIYVPVFAITMAILRADFTWRAAALAHLRAGGSSPSPVEPPRGPVAGQ